MVRAFLLCVKQSQVPAAWTPSPRKGNVVLPFPPGIEDRPTCPASFTPFYLSAPNAVLQWRLAASPKEETWRELMRSGFA